MKVVSAPALAAAAVSNIPVRPATVLAYDSPGARIVLFRIAAGQAVPSHTSPSTVVLTVVSGSGIVSGAGGDRAVGVGDIVAYEPDEPHGMRAADEPLVLGAMIAPRPAAT